MVLPAAAGWPASAAAVGGPTPSNKLKQAVAPVREYLPVLLQKSLLESDRAHLKRLQAVLALFRGIQEGGDISQGQINETKGQVLRTRIQVLRRQKAYADSLDRFKLRSRHKPQRLRETEAAVVRPFSRNLRGFQEVFDDYYAFPNRLAKFSGPKAAPRLRAELRKLYATVPLVKGTRFRRRFPGRWAKIERLADKDLQSRRSQYQEQRRELLDRKTDFEVAGKRWPKAEQKRLEEINQQIALIDLERDLRRYTAERGKKERKPPEDQFKAFHLLTLAAAVVLVPAFRERLEELRASWPALPPVRIGNLDMLNCGLEEADRAVALQLKKPEARAAAWANLRTVRNLAATYRLQKRLIELSHSGEKIALDELANPNHSIFQPLTPGQVQNVLRAEHSLARVRSGIWRTWIKYQVARLKLLQLNY
jgi:hypothetical protein